MDKLYIGSRVTDLYPGLETLPITKVELLDENGDIKGEAGDDTGRTLTATNPDGTDAMAADILATVGGFVYRPYEGEDALIDPSAELGDGVTVGGLYSVLAQESITFDELYSSDISAPTTDEIEDEYPYINPIERQIKRNYNRTYSLITKTVEEIRLEVEATDGRITALSVTLEGVTITDENGQTLIKGSSIDTSTIKANSITVDKLYLTGSISWGDLATDAQNQVTSAQNTALSAYSLANTANNNASSAINSVSAWTYPGSTYINGNMLMTGTVVASRLLGGYVGLLNAYQQTLGQIAIGASSSGEYAIELNSTGGGLRLSAAANFWIDSAYGSMGITNSGIVCSVPPVPQSANNVSLGTYGFPWSDIYTSYGRFSALVARVEALEEKL